MRSFKLPFFVFVICLWLNDVIGGELRIKSADELIEFSNNVNKGTNYSGTTVFLGSDLDLTGKTFEPIGNSSNYFNGTSSNYFLGVFDGQGHVVSNLIMNSTSDFVGLFGYSRGLTIRNVILDSSCSITSYYSSSGAFVGGIIGLCRADYGSCIIENSVDMGNVTFNGTASSELRLGGITGYLYSWEYDSFVKNCANYGDVTHSGTNGYSYIGGVVGMSYSSSANKIYIYNSLNHGTVTHVGTTTDCFWLGGIAGYTERTTIENCVSGGKIFSTTSSSGNYVAGIVGRVYDGTTVNYCYYTSDLNGWGKYWYRGYTPTESNVLKYDSTSFQLSGTVSVGTYTGSSLIDALNGYADYKGRNYSHWLLNKEKKAVSFTINGRKNSIKMDYQIILMPSPASEGNKSFDGWYMDSKLTVPLTSLEVNESISLYGALFSSLIVVTFDVNGGDALLESESTKGMAYNSTCGDLPEPERTGYTFAGWFTEAEGGEEVKSGDVVKIAEDQALYARWTPNIYTITFNTTTDGDGSTQFLQSVTYDSEYGALPEPERTGYTFAGWFTEEDGQGERITEETIVSIAENHTLYGHWTINNYTITFEYGNGADAEKRVLNFNERIEYPEVVVREGYTFAGWDMKPDTVPAEDLTIKAQWTPNNYTLSFDGCGGEGVGNEKKNVTYDNFYGPLPEPERTGYTFVGWFTEENGQGDKIESGGLVKVTGDVTLHAHWIINQYTITFEVDGGNECKPITQDYSTEIVFPEPTKTGYTFDCWCSDPELSREYIETTMPAENVILYAKWSINQYTLTFIFNNGAENEVRTLDFNEEIVYPENVEKTGYSFGGWDNKVDRMPAENITVTAQWASIEEPEEPEKPTNPTDYVEIVFGKGFTEEEVKDILSDYTKEGFTIVEFERDEKTVETRVIVKFNDKNDAEEFVENIDKNEKPEHFIRDVDFVSGKSSFSTVLILHSMVYLLF